MSARRYRPRRALAAPGLSAGLSRLTDTVPHVGSVLWQYARRHVGGRDLAEALGRADQLVAKGCGVSLDLFGVETGEVHTARVGDAYADLVTATSGRRQAVWLSADPSHLGLRESWSTCVRALERIAGELGPGRRLQIGAETEDLAENTLRAVLKVAAQGAPVMATVQANLRRSSDDAARLAAAGVPVRLVKGAFTESPKVSWPRGEWTDMSFARIAHRIRKEGGDVTLATHDRLLRETLLLSLGPLPCEVSLGIRPHDVDCLLRRGIDTRVYIPYGPDWLRFYLRRLAETPPRRLRK
ncbi:proline dehydrogenase [Streptomyces sp. V4I23]|nr:proline dehydrogenase [Streptomyces sp. V4I23]